MQFTTHSVPRETPFQRLADCSTYCVSEAYFRCSISSKDKRVIISQCSGATAHKYRTHTGLDLALKAGRAFSMGFGSFFCSLPIFPSGNDSRASARLPRVARGALDAKKKGSSLTRSQTRPGAPGVQWPSTQRSLIPRVSPVWGQLGHSHQRCHVFPQRQNLTPCKDTQFLFAHQEGGGAPTELSH